MASENVLNQVVAINLDIHLWSGRKKLHQEDLKRVSGDQLPPKDLASLGSKKICDPTEVATFERIKRRAERACAAIGVRFLGGYAIPEDRQAELEQTLAELRQEFQAEKAAFLSRYDQVVEDWAGAHPNWARIIRSAVTPAAAVDAQMSFDYQVFRVVEAQASAQDHGKGDGLGRQVRGLAGRLFQEVAAKAQESLEVSIQGRARVTQKALRPIRAIQAKLDGLCFLDPRVAPVVAWVQESLERLPKVGHIEGADLVALETMVATLSDPDRVIALGEARLSLSEQDIQDSDEDESLESTPEITPEPAHETAEAEQADAISGAGQTGDLLSFPGRPAERLEHPETEQEPEIPPVVQTGTWF